MLDAAEKNSFGCPPLLCKVRCSSLLLQISCVRASSRSGVAIAAICLCNRALPSMHLELMGSRLQTAEPAWMSWTVIDGV